MKKVLIIVAIIVLIITALVVILYSQGYKIDLTKKLTSEECVQKGGKVLNILTLKPFLNYNPKDVIGEVLGVKCPCVCIKK